MTAIEIDPAVRRQLAADLFNHTWALLDKADRTAANNDEMIHSAHASRYHWGEVRDHEPVNLARGEWLCSRVYAILGRAEPALWHARRCLAINEAAARRLGHRRAYEAMARATSSPATPGGRAGKRRRRRARGIADKDDAMSSRATSRRSRSAAATLDSGHSRPPDPEAHPCPTSSSASCSGARPRAGRRCSTRPSESTGSATSTLDLGPPVRDLRRPVPADLRGLVAAHAWAMETEQTRLGLLVGANTFRNPGSRRQDRHDARPHQRRPGDPRHRRGLDGARAPGPRHRIRDRASASGSTGWTSRSVRCGACSTASR